MKRERKIAGVTMVALVVTIIIMLILAGIVITLTLGDKGILTRAKQATELYKKAEEDEQIQLNNLYTQLASNNNGGDINISEMSSLMRQIIEEERLKEYPVGSIYISQSERNPSEFIGGEWEQIKDTFLLSAGDTYEAGTTGGEATHTLTVAEMPSHKHPYLISPDCSALYKAGSAVWTHNMTATAAVATRETSAVGGSQAHNNMPPYLTVYMYKRIN